MQHIEFRRSFLAEINDGATIGDATVGNSDDDGFTIRQVSNAHLGADWQLIMRGRQLLTSGAALGE